MTTIHSERKYTPDDLLLMPDGKRFELVDGGLVDQTCDALTSRLVALVGGLVAMQVELFGIGGAFGSLGYRCFAEDGNRVRRPDVSFISKARLRAEHLTGFVPIPPDLAVEVVSENDLYYEVEEKVEEYLRAGVQLVWVFNPQRRSVRVYRQDRSVAEIDERGELSGETVLPGLTLPLQPLFATPAMAASETHEHP